MAWARPNSTIPTNILANVWKIGDPNDNRLYLSLCRDVCKVVYVECAYVQLLGESIVVQKDKPQDRVDSDVAATA